MTATPWLSQSPAAHLHHIERARTELARYYPDMAPSEIGDALGEIERATLALRVLLLSPSASTSAAVKPKQGFRRP